MANNFSDIVKRYCKLYVPTITTIKLIDQSIIVGAIQSLHWKDDFRFTAYTIRCSVQYPDYWNNLYGRRSIDVQWQIEIDDGFDIVRAKNAYMCKIGPVSFTDDCITLHNADFMPESIERIFWEDIMHT